MLLETEPCTHAGDNKQKQHKPRVNKILIGILIPHFRYGSNHAEGNDAVEHVNHMVNHHQDDGDPSDVVNVGLSHICTTFAIYFNIMVAQTQT